MAKRTSNPKRSAAQKKANARVVLDEVASDAEAEQPRETRRSKRAREEATAQGDDDAHNGGAAAKGSHGQRQKKAKQAQAPGAEPTRRKRANTSELQPDAVKKAKGTTHRPPIVECDSSDASEHQPSPTPRERRAQRKRQGSPSELTGVADALNGLRVDDVEDDAEEGGPSEESSGSEFSKPSTRDEEEEEGSEKFGVSGEDSGGDAGDAGHGHGQSRPAKTKGARDKCSSAREQLELAVPTFEPTKGKAAGTNATASVSSRKGARSAAAPDRDERALAPTSDSESGDASKPRRKALPKRVKPTTATSATLTTDGASNNGTEAAARVTSTGQNQKTSSGAKKTQTSSVSKSGSKMPANSPKTPASATKTGASASKNATPATKMPAGNAAGVQHSGSPATIASAKSVRANPARSSKSQSTPKTAASAGWEEGREIELLEEEEEEVEVEIRDEEQSDNANADGGEEDEGVDEPSNANTTPSTNRSTPSAPLDIELRPLTGGKIGNLGDQKAPVKAVLHEATTKQLHLVLGWTNFMPKDLAYRIELSRQALIAAAKKVRQVEVETRLREDEAYATRLGGLVRDRMSSIRNELKARASKKIAEHYEFAKYGGKDKLALGIANLTKAPGYLYIFPGNSFTERYEKEALFCHPAIIQGLSDSYLGKRPKARLPTKWYTSSIKEGEGSEEPEVPAPMLAFQAVATLACLKDHQSGSHVAIAFHTSDDAEDSYGEAYKNHMTTLLGLKQKNPDGYHTLMHYLYMAASGLVMIDEHTDPASTSGGIENPEVDLTKIGSTLKLRRRN
ncbi:hypothetical protein BV25DRAFT_1921536 [Artomyces pyxidatus]|uniref:Uncharacterized protein n=1 Tax=Artomyces pyxidatus TaxID=48021 RepID=A0ACB8SHU4_9AGAM|nr:hypothetical protein BV25DRAFT_1921536 [Artomyces pyxidatus]